MLLTSDEVRNVLKNLEVEKKRLITDINKMSTYKVSLSEFGRVEEIKPKFDLIDTVESIAEIDRQVLKIRHDRNVFNATTFVEDTGMTVDEVLIRIAELSNLSSILERLCANRDKERMTTLNKEPEYQYLNYNLDDVKRMYGEVENEKSNLQNKLDLLNATVQFECNY